MDEAGIQYVGLILVSSLPVWNNGKPLVAQRQAEHHRALVAVQQAQQRAISQVRAAVVRWNGATDLVNDSAGLTEDLGKEVASMERLFELRQTDLTRLMQARQRLIQLDTARLDAVWAATQAQADLLLALGTPTLIHSMLNQAEGDAMQGAPSAPQPASPSASASAPPSSTTAAARTPMLPATTPGGPRPEARRLDLAGIEPELIERPRPPLMNRPGMTSSGIRPGRAATKPADDPIAGREEAESEQTQAHRGPHDAQGHPERPQGKQHQRTDVRVDEYDAPGRDQRGDQQDRPRPESSSASFGAVGLPA